MTRQLAMLLLCATAVGTSARATPRQQVPTTAASISYELPTTLVTVTVDLTLTSCSGGIRATPAVTITPASGPAATDQHRFTLNGPELNSLTRSRQVSIDIYPNGALKSISASVSDRTFAIITSILKFAVAVAALDSSGAVPLGPCNDSTADALRASETLKRRIDQLRAQLVSGSSGSAADLSDEINALAAERARLLTGPLQLTLTAHVAPSQNVPTASFAGRVESAGGYISWQRSDFAKWVRPDGADGSINEFQLGYCFARRQNPEAACDSGRIDGGVRHAAEISHLRADDQFQKPACAPDCSQTLVFREPVSANMSVIVQSAGFSRNGANVAAGTVLKTGDVSIAQWGELTYLPLRVGFGGSRTIALGLDEFGRRTHFEWKSDARLESIAGGAADAAGQAIALRNAVNGRSAAERQAEITELQAQQTLNTLRYCQAVIESGGFVCPTPPAAPAAH